MLLSGLDLSEHAGTWCVCAKCRAWISKKCPKLKAGDGRNLDRGRPGRRRWIGNGKRTEVVFSCVFPWWRAVCSLTREGCQGLSPWQPGLYLTCSPNTHTERGPWLLTLWNLCKHTHTHTQTNSPFPFIYLARVIPLPVYAALKTLQHVSKQQLTWHARCQQRAHKVMGSGVLLCKVCLALSALKRASVLVRLHSAAVTITQRRSRRSDHNKAAAHKRQDGAVNERGMHRNTIKCRAWKIDGLMGGWFKWQEKWQMLLDKWMDWQIDGRADEWIKAESDRRKSHSPSQKMLCLTRKQCTKAPQVLLRVAFTLLMSEVNARNGRKEIWVFCVIGQTGERMGWFIGAVGAWRAVLFYSLQSRHPHHISPCLISLITHTHIHRVQGQVWLTNISVFHDYAMWLQPKAFLLLRALTSLHLFHRWWLFICDVVLVNSLLALQTADLTQVAILISYSSYLI